MSCLDCRNAHHLPNSIAPAAPADAHLRALSRRGVGSRRVAAVAGVSRSILALVLAGRRDQVRRRTADRVLAVPLSRPPHAEAALVPAGPTWRLLQRMLDDGYPAVRLARWLGQRGSGLQVGRDRVTVRTARKVRELAGWLLAEAVAS